MAQISSGTADLFNGNSSVSLPGSDLSTVPVGAAFHRPGIDAVYSIIAVDALATPPTVQLSVPYAGADETGAPYRITTGWSPNFGLYEPDPADADIVMLLKHRLVRRLDTLLRDTTGSLSIGNGGADIDLSGSAYSTPPHVSVTIYDATAGDYAHITNLTASGFNLVVRDFSNQPVARQVSWLAKGV